MGSNLEKALIESRRMSIQYHLFEDMRCNKEKLKEKKLIFSLLDYWRDLNSDWWIAV